MDPVSFEAAIAAYPLQFPSIRDPRVEYARFPSLVERYWTLTGGLWSRPVTQEVFAESIVKTMVSVGSSLPVEAVRARACRAFPSLVRQHHFELVLRGSFEVVVREHLLDMSGIDFLIVHEGEAVGLGLSIDTPGAYTWRRVKERRHPLPPTLAVLYLLHTDRRVGRFWLHDPQQVEEVRAFIADARARRHQDLRAEILGELGGAA